MSLDDAFDQVAEFHRAFGHPVKERPTFLPPPRSDARVAWMREEVDEFVESTNVVDQADAMIDLIYFALGTLVEMGVRPAPLFDIVHNANMQKLWPDGAARIRVRASSRCSGSGESTCSLPPSRMPVPASAITPTSS